MPKNNWKLPAAALADMELKAPFTGTTSKINVREGEWVNTGQNAMLLADLTQLTGGNHGSE